MEDSWSRTKSGNFRRCVVVAQPVADFGRRHLLAALVTSQKSLMRRTVASHASMNASPEQPVGEPSLLRLLQEMPTKNLARHEPLSDYVHMDKRTLWQHELTYCAVGSIRHHSQPPPLAQSHQTP